MDRAVDRVLERLSDAQVEALAAACEPRQTPDGTLDEVVVGALPGGREAVDRLARAWRLSPAVTGAGVALALRASLRARGERRMRRTQPVWTGPGASGEQRLTAAVLHELVTGARERVLVVSFAAYTLAGLASDLSEAVSRGCAVDVVFETEADSAGAYASAPAAPFGSVDGIHRWRWPLERRTEQGAVLHAKLLVVDGRRALVGSANLTHRALHANLEAGVLVGDSEVAASLERHVRSLMATGTLVRDL